MSGETISPPASQGRDHRVGFDGSGGQLMHKYEIIIYWSNDDEAFLAEVRGWQQPPATRRSADLRDTYSF
jgi:hypothetical protein